MNREIRESWIVFYTRNFPLQASLLFSLFIVHDGSLHFINIRYQKRLSVELCRRNRADAREFPQEGKAIPWHGVKTAQLLTPRSLPFYHGGVVRVPGQFTAEIRDSLGI